MKYINKLSKKLEIIINYDKSKGTGDMHEKLTNSYIKQKNIDYCRMLTLLILNIHIS